MSCSKCNNQNTNCGCSDSYLTTNPNTLQSTLCPTPTPCSEYVNAKCVYITDGIFDAALPPLTTLEQVIQQLVLMITNPECTQTDSCNCPGGGGSLELKVNDVDNQSQTILNLKNGSNIEIVDSGSGNITISNTYVPINLPVPKVLLKTQDTDTGWDTINGISNNTEVVDQFQLYRSPIVSVMDIPQEVIDTYNVFVEMVVYKFNNKGKSFVVPPAYTYNSGTDTGSNPLETFLATPLKTRGGVAKVKRGSVPPFTFEPLRVSRPNHYRVTTTGQQIPVYEYLNGRFSIITEEYWNHTTLSPSNINLPIPYYRIGPSPSTSAFNLQGYFEGFKPLYIGFRYVAWDSEANDGLGDFVSGPLSETIAISSKYFPFNLVTKGFRSGTPSVVTPSSYQLNPKYTSPSELSCWFVHRK